MEFVQPIQRMRHILTLPEKQFIVNVYNSTLQENPESKLLDICAFVAKTLDVGLRTVQRIIKEYKDNQVILSPNNGRTRVSLLDEIDDADLYAIRNKHQAQRRNMNDKAMEETQDIVEFPLKVLGLIGIFSKTKSKRVIATAGFYVLITLFLTCVCLLQFLYVEGDVTEFTFNFEALGGFLQVGLKFFLVAYQQKDLIELIKDTKAFWKTKRCSAEFKTQLDGMLSRILKLEKLFLGAMLACAILSDFSVLFGRALPLGIWKMEGSKLLYELYLGTIAVYMLLIATFLGAFDALFMALCTKSVIQFRILCHCITQENVTDAGALADESLYHKNLRECIQYHIFMLRFLKSLRKMFASVLFSQYISSSSLICVDMYALLEVKNIGLQARQGILVMTQIVQFAFYCIATQYVTDEAVKVSDAIYKSGWYFRNSNSLRSILTIAVQKAQQEIYFKAGGLVDINATTLLTVIKASWSICTVMRRLKY